MSITVRRRRIAGSDAQGPDRKMIDSRRAVQVLLRLPKVIEDIDGLFEQSDASTTPGEEFESEAGQSPIADSRTLASRSWRLKQSAIHHWRSWGTKVIVAVSALALLGLAYLILNGIGSGTPNTSEESKPSTALETAPVWDGGIEETVPYDAAEPTENKHPPDRSNGPLPSNERFHPKDADGSASLDMNMFEHGIDCDDTFQYPTTDAPYDYPATNGSGIGSAGPRLAEDSPAYRTSFRGASHTDSSDPAQPGRARLQGTIEPPPVRARYERAGSGTY